MAKMVFEILNCFYLRKYSYLESIMNAWNGSFFNLMISHIHNQSQSTLNSSSTCDVHCFSLRYVFDHLKKIAKIRNNLLQNCILCMYLVKWRLFVHCGIGVECTTRPRWSWQNHEQICTVSLFSSKLTILK